MNQTVDEKAQAFDAKLPAWLEYVNSPGGQLRHAEIVHHLRAHLGGQSLRVLDACGGTGELAADLANDGHRVTLLDFSRVMIEEAARRCAEAGQPVACVCADVMQLETLFAPETFDVVLCHSALEFTDKPQSVIAQLARVLRGSGLLSVVVGNRYHTLLRAALVQQNFDVALQGLDVELPTTDLFGLPRRTFYPEAIRPSMQACGLRLVGEYGIRIFYDLLDNPSSEQIDSLLALELAAGARWPYCHMARFIQFVAEKT